MKPALNVASGLMFICVGSLSLYFLLNNVSELGLKHFESVNSTSKQLPLFLMVCLK